MEDGKLVGGGRWEKGIHIHVKIGSGGLDESDRCEMRQLTDVMLCRLCMFAFWKKADDLMTT